MKISKKWIEDRAQEYDKANSKEAGKERRILTSIAAIGLPPKKLTKSVLKRIVAWKAVRVKKHANKNKPCYVEEVTAVSFTANSDKLRLEVLTLLSGVSVRMASAILWFSFPDNYSVMDIYAWASLRKLGLITGEIKDSYDCYSKYNKTCGRIAKKYGVSRRVLDKALWHYNGGVET